MPAGFGPVQGKIRITEAPILAYLESNEFGEVMYIQLEQISQGRLVLKRRRDDFNASRDFHSVIICGFNDNQKTDKAVRVANHGSGVGERRVQEVCKSSFENVCAGANVKTRG